MKWPYCLNCAIFPPNKKELHGEQCAVRLDLSTKCAQACAMRHTRFDRWSAVLVFLRGQMASEQKRICSVAGSLIKFSNCHAGRRSITWQQPAKTGLERWVFLHRPMTTWWQKNRLFRR